MTDASTSWNGRKTLLSKSADLDDRCLQRGVTQRQNWLQDKNEREQMQDHHEGVQERTECR